MLTLRILLLLGLVTLTTSVSGVCTASATSSPIDIVLASAKYCSASEMTYVEFLCNSYPDYSFESGTTTGKLVFPNNVARVIFDSNFDGSHSRAVATGKTVSFHSKSEHKIKGTQYDLQMRIILDPVASADVNAQIDESNIELTTSYTKTAVKAMFSDGATIATTNKVVLSFLFKADTGATDTDFFNTQKTGAEKVLNFKNLFDCMSDRFFYRYRGQLNEQTCTTNVEWLIAREPILISSASINLLKTAGPITAALQATNSLGDRTIRLAGAPCHPAA